MLFPFDLSEILKGTNYHSHPETFAHFLVLQFQELAARLVKINSVSAKSSPWCSLSSCTALYSSVLHLLSYLCVFQVLLLCLSKGR